MTFQIFCCSPKVTPGVIHEGYRPSARDKSAPAGDDAHYAGNPFLQFPLSR